MQEGIVKQLIGSLILTAVLILLGIVIPLTLGLGTGEIANQEIANQIDFYQKFYWSLVIIWSVWIALIFIKKNNIYGDSIGFYDLKEKTMIKTVRNMSGIQKTLLSLIFFSIIFLIATYMRLGGFTGLRVLPQQFSKTQSLLFSTLLIPVPENLLLGGIIALFVLGLTLIAIKYKISIQEYKTYLFIGLFVFGGLFGFTWHQTAYPNSDTANYVIFTFWGLGAVISVATGFFGTFLIIHMQNNFFIDFSRLFVNDNRFLVVIITIIILSIIYFLLYKNNLFGQGKKSEEILK
jgi:hypothetical protein